VRERGSKGERERERERLRRRMRKTILERLPLCVCVCLRDRDILSKINRLSQEEKEILCMKELQYEND
jgi:hypothetical protein